jgi:DNA-binding beta-propeller fold protein YncE
MFLTPTGDARAADQIYWPNFSGDIFFSNLDGSAGGPLTPTGANVDQPTGAASDPVGGRIYWTNQAGAAISFANLDGSGGGNLAIGAAPVNLPNGLAIDPVTRRVYWANGSNSGSIAFANLDGSGGGQLPTGAATIEGPRGVAIDPVAGRIYWANRLANTISFANLDGSGGGNLPTGTAPIAAPVGVAIDPVNGRVYWAGADGIAFAKLDGSGKGQLLLATGEAVQFPRGVNVDPLDGKIYWANSNSLGVANLDGSGAHKLRLGGAAFASNPQYPSLLVTPRSATPPAVTGGTGVGATLTCQPGQWASSGIEPFYQAPESLSVKWSRNGVEIKGATGPSITPVLEGDYSCQETAVNRVGPATAVSAPYHFAIARPSHDPSHGRVSLKLAAAKIRAGAPLPITVTNDGDVEVSGSLSARSTVTVGRTKRGVKLKAKPFRLAAKTRATVKLTLPGPLRRELVRRHKLSISLSATFAASGAASQTVASRAVPKLKT